MIPEEVFGELKGKGNTRVLVQLPEGLKAKATEIASELSAKGFEPIVSGDPCFGACDLKTLKGATTLHVGHSEFVKQENIVYWDYEYDQDLVPAFEKALIGMHPGEKKTILLTSENAFGQYSEELIATVKRENLPKDLQVKVGDKLQIQEPDGSLVFVKVQKLTDSEVVFDANHPLAGKDLTFNIELIEIV